MKYIGILVVIGVLASITLTTSSCDKVDHPYPPDLSIDTTLIEGTWQNYLDNYWPDFNSITASPNRNALIEDFTGHRCPNCPTAATIAHDLHHADPERVFIASIHSSPVGMSTFQQEDVNAGYPSILYNSAAFEIGTFFGNYADANFFANPQGAVNRIKENGAIFSQYSEWATRSSNVLNSTLKVKIKSKLNYFESKRGVYLHTEVENLGNAITNELGIVVALIEDSLVAPQTMPDNTKNATYIHRDIFRGCIDNLAFGQTLTAAFLKDGKYYVNYSYKLPDVYAPENTHLLIYVFDKSTYEIYQVVKEKLK